MKGMTIQQRPGNAWKKDAWKLFIRNHPKHVNKENRR